MRSFFFDISSIAEFADNQKALPFGRAFRMSIKRYSLPEGGENTENSFEYIQKYEVFSLIFRQ